MLVFLPENHPSQDYYRAPHPSDAEKRRVSFKKTSHNNRIGKKFNKDWGNSLRAHLEDEDVDMGQEAGASSNNPHKWRRNTKFNGKPNKRFGSPAPTGRRKLIEGPGGGWYKVTVRKRLILIFRPNSNISSLLMDESTRKASF